MDLIHCLAAFEPRDGLRALLWLCIGVGAFILVAIALVALLEREWTPRRPPAPAAPRGATRLKP